MRAALARDGFVMVPALVVPAEIAALIAALETADMARAERNGQTFGARNLLDLAEVRAIAQSRELSALLTPLLGPGHRVVRGLFFDKTAGANWPVLWHQDLSLAVQERREHPGWNNWSVKRGVLHVQPPAHILARMVTMRLHLDDCDAQNGPLRVIAGSHADGILSRDAIRRRTEGNDDQVVLAKAGDALFMRPLILHASSPAARPRHRRVLHLEFAPANLLPENMTWAVAASAASQP
jgi:ectoine hydroxylase-related dioxygenase (phytanoyl-CoA dioxygenase family)